MKFPILSNRDTGGVNGIVTNTTGVTGGESDISSSTPGDTPGVLDVPISTGGGTGQQHTVVQVVSTVREHSGPVEGPVGGINGDGDGLVLEGLVKGVTVTRGNVGLSRKLEITTVELTELVLGGIRILSLSGQTVLDHVLVGSVHQTSLTSEIALKSGTIHQLLLRPVSGSLVLDQLEGLEGGNGGEGPARSARSLVLHGGHLSLSVPIDGGIVLNGDISLTALGGGDQGQVSGGELFLGHVHELVLTEGETEVLVVHVLDVVLVVLEDGQSVGLQIVGSVLSAILDLPGGEVVDEFLVNLGVLQVGDGGLLLEEVGGSGEEGHEYDSEKELGHFGGEKKV